MEIVYKMVSSGTREEQTYLRNEQKRGKEEFMIQKNIFVKTFIDDSFSLTRMLLCEFCSKNKMCCVWCDPALIQPTGIAIDPLEPNVEWILRQATRQTTKINNIVMNSLLAGDPHLEEGL